MRKHVYCEKCGTRLITVHYVLQRRDDLQYAGKVETKEVESYCIYAPDWCSQVKAA